MHTCTCAAVWALLHMCAPQDLSLDLSLWQPIVEDRGIVPWLVKVPSEKDLRRARTLTMVQVGPSLSRLPGATPCRMRCIHACTRACGCAAVAVYGSATVPCWHCSTPWAQRPCLYAAPVAQRRSAQALLEQGNGKRR